MLLSVAMRSAPVASGSRVPVCHIFLIPVIPRSLRITSKLVNPIGLLIRKNILFLEFWITRLTRMREKSWSMCPLEFATLQESSITKYIEIPKINEDTAYHVGPIDEVRTRTNSEAILETLSAICGVLSIIAHHPVCISWYEELISLDIIWEICMSTIGR